jgi:zinc transporter 1/2/3
MLVTSSIGVFAPILIAKFVSPRNILFTILRQFGTGVIISTAFIHLFTHANLMFQSECLGELAYESTAAAILMGGIFISFLVEYAGLRLIQWHAAKAASAGVESNGLSPSVAAAKSEMINITVLEAGVIFHSLLIGLTLVVSGDSFFLTLFAVIVFHQMFEGMALGTRIAALGQQVPLGHNHNQIHAHGHGHGHSHAHSHEPKAHTPATVAEELLAVSASVPQDGPERGSTGEKSGEESERPLANSTDTPSRTVPLSKKLALAAGFAIVTPLGMAIGIGVLQHFNGNDPSTIVAIGTLDALSAGILVWVGVVEMWAHDWMLGGEMTTASPARTALGMAALVAGMALMSLLGKWA